MQPGASAGRPFMANRVVARRNGSRDESFATEREGDVMMPSTGGTFKPEASCGSGFAPDVRYGRCNQSKRLRAQTVKATGKRK